MSQYWSLSQNAEGLLDLNLNLSGLLAEDVASQLWALHEMVVRREKRNLSPEETQPSGRVSFLEETQPIATKTQPETQPIATMHWSCSEIARVVGVSTRVVRKRAQSWEGGRKRVRGKGLEYPLSSLPGSWQSLILARLYPAESGD